MTDPKFKPTKPARSQIQKVKMLLKCFNIDSSVFTMFPIYCDTQFFCFFAKNNGYPALIDYEQIRTIEKSEFNVMSMNVQKVSYFENEDSELLIFHLHANQ